VTFLRGDYFEHNSQPYYENHYYIAKNQVCETCKKPIKKSCVSTMGKKFHLEYFTCTFCLKVLNNSTFKDMITMSGHIASQAISRCLGSGGELNSWYIYCITEHLQLYIYCITERLQLYRHC